MTGRDALATRPLRVHEAAFVLRLPEAEVLRRIHQGELEAASAGSHRRVTAGAVRRGLSDDALANLVLNAILNGVLRAPRATRPSMQPPTLASVARSL